MALARKLVELHGGTIRVESAGKNRGSVFIVALPILSPHDDQRVSKNEEPSPVKKAPMKNILVVDDNRQISSFLVGSVLPSLGYQTLVAYDGKSALEIVRKHHRYIDLMLLDLQ